MFGKDKKKLSDSEKKAKLTALKEAHGMASDMLKDNLSGMKKVTVASDSSKGLKEGLKKAESLLGAQKLDQQESEEPESEEGDEMDEQESSELESEIPDGCDSAEEIDALIAKLEKKKRELETA